MAKRWECPTREHAGILAPARMRPDDARRYCLDCTARTGRLTERVSPALVRERAKDAERNERRRERRRAATQERRRRREDPVKLKQTTDGMAIEPEWDRLRALQCWDDWGVRGHIQRIQLQVFGGRKPAPSARYWPSTRKVHVTAGLAPGWHVSETLLHELVHAAQRALDSRSASGRRTRPHGEHFHRMLLYAAVQANGLTEADQEDVRTAYTKAGGARRAYSMDWALEAVLGRDRRATDLLVAA